MTTQTETRSGVATGTLARLRARNPYLNGLLSPRGITGLIIVGLLALAGLLAPALADFAPTAQSDQALHSPGGAHPLGTDEVGRDLFSRVLHGIRNDLAIILIAVPVAALAGSLLALLATASRAADAVVQRFFDLVLAFPGLILALAITAIMGPGFLPVVIVIALAETPGFGRVLRAGILVQREREYAVAARVGGAGRARVLIRHVLPNAVDPLIVQLAISLPVAVFIEGAMSFLGVGVRPPEPTLGSVLSQSMPYLSSHPWYAAAPLITVTGLVLGFTLIAEALNKGVRR
ncbi:ABC transporter permease [Streptomyces litchfieldiae]|uniref:ABC transporter permease n=1 Tax=Streptomyces litchfieldiae TaxID=3075543 RepID=A0ABU2MWA5_9ACTN|nr:ABC transporter permease [Streptomyces sp. DSM 44938]MDT0345926.1 ABC transporter permease [Streptomyces sp. DSM 44938]